MNPRLHPAWKQAVLDLMELDPQPGHVVTKAWMLEHFELPVPSAGDPEAFNRWSLVFLSYRDSFRRRLEEEHSLIFTYMESASGGIRLLAPGEVAEYEDSQWRKNIGNEIRRTTRRMKHTNLLAMSSDERDRHLNFLARRNWQAKQLRDSAKSEIPQKFVGPALPKLRLSGEGDQSDGGPTSQT